MNRPQLTNQRDVINMKKGLLIAIILPFIVALFVKILESSQTTLLLYAPYVSWIIITLIIILLTLMILNDVKSIYIYVTEWKLWLHLNHPIRITCRMNLSLACGTSTILNNQSNHSLFCVYRY